MGAAPAVPGFLGRAWWVATPVWPRIGGGGLAARGMTGALIHAEELLEPVVDCACCGLGSGVRVEAGVGDAGRVVAS
jgi:hypothetical protein